MENLTDTRESWIKTLNDARTYGADLKGSRFEAYLATLDELVGLQNRRKTDADAYRGFREDLQRQELLFEAASQMLQLQLASFVWSRLDPTVLARKLKTVSRGAVMPIDGAGPDESRDTLVELFAAAIMAENGFSPQLTASDEDLRFDLPERPTIVAECKRPVGKDTLPTAIGRLRDQFWRRKSQGATLCMPIIAVERIEPFASLLIKAESSDQVDREVRRRMTLAIIEIQRICRDDPRRHLGTLSPAGIATFSGAVLVRRPKTYLHPFTVRLPFDTGDEKDTPEWLAEQFRWSTGLLAEFAQSRLE